MVNNWLNPGQYPVDSFTIDYSKLGHFQMATQLFQTTYKHDHLGITLPSGETDYRKVAEFLNLDSNAISKLAKVSKSSVRYDEKIPQGVKDRLDEIANVCNLVAEYFKGDISKTAIWFKAPNPMLGNISPRDMIRLGRYGKLLNFILDAQAENALSNGKKK